MSTETQSARYSAALRAWADVIDPAGRPMATRHGVLLPGFEVNKPAPGSTDLPAEMRQTLYELAGVISALPKERRPTILQLLGRASQTPPVPAGNPAALTGRRRKNRELSYRRAHAVLLALKEDGVVAGDASVSSVNDSAPQSPAAADEISLVAGGEDVPWEDLPDTEHPLNRSVEIKWEVPVSPPLDVVDHPVLWGVLRIENTVTINGLALITIAKQGGIKAALRAWPTAPLKKKDALQYVSVAAGPVVHIGYLEHRPPGASSGTKRNIAIVGGNYSAALKAPEPGALDLLGVVTWTQPLGDSPVPVRAADANLSMDELQSSWLFRPGVGVPSIITDVDMTGWFFLDRRFRRHLATAKGPGAAVTTGVKVLHIGVGAQIAKVHLFPDYDPHRSGPTMLWEATRTLGPEVLGLLP
jgi:hypothetical protein